MLTVLFWKKVWAWLKHYWYWPVIILLLLFSIITRSTLKDKLFDLLDKQKENYEKEIEIVKETAKETDEKKTEIFTKHIEEIKKIEQEHDVKLEDLEKEKQEELVEILEENKEKPDKLAEEIAKILSAEFLKRDK